MPVITIAGGLRQLCRTIDQIDAQMLLQFVLKVNKAFILTHPEYVLTSAQTVAFNDLVARRKTGEPVAYLIGEREFYDLTFKVTPAVLIPRPETELLVELALTRIDADGCKHILDLGTGCGSVAITIAKHRPQSDVVAVDLSIDAVSVARINAHNHALQNLSIITGNWFDKFADKKFDLIVSNPPYVAVGDPHLLQGDLRFEPQIALTAGDNGLACLHDIVVTAPKYLNADGWLLLEHGYDQSDACQQLLAEAGFRHIFSHPDLAGMMRVSGGKL